MQKNLKVSIIIPVIAINDYIRESVPKMLELDWPDFEIIIFPDEEDTKHKWPKTRIIASGKVGPAEKRDMALKYAKGEIIAFLDDDAYPEPDWIKKAVKHFHKKEVAGVGGPAVTPADDNVLQKVSGAVFESYVGGAGARNRYLPIGKTGETSDWPTVNLMVRKAVFAKVGGFDNTFWPGEDTKLCLDIKKAGYKLIYEPKAVVYHHRRSDIIKHFKQIGNYGLHRGHFAKIYPETSRKLFYFAPTLFDLYLISIPIAFYLLHSTFYTLPSTLYFLLYLIPLTAYCLLLTADAIIISVRYKNPLIGLITIPMVFLTHVWYGIKFVQGLIAPKLER